MLTFITSNLLWTQGFYIAAVLIVCTVLGYFLFRPLLYVSLGLFLFSFYFFRNPERECLEAKRDASVLICPSDGVVVDVQFDKDNKLEGYAQKVSIFLSPIDVHVNWTPMAGTIQDIIYKTGTFSMAFLPKSSEFNERNDIVIADEQGKTILVRQIAGTVARRICCWVPKGQSVPAGYKYGMIRFGSRVDILMPAEVILAVGVGQRVVGGQTVLGRWQ
ncbi:MAG: phosphatidylserine decarboxylase [Candidatus Dependentiae bacterium]|nr:phosphatidylserine decarboxylase [Candidatus Dependentiae bacterium]